MLTKTIPSYLYNQYSDDSDLQAFVASFNAMTQEYVDWFNQIGLPVYTGSQITDLLLDWIATGIYGLPRPVLSNGQYQISGLINTGQINTLQLNQSSVMNNAQLFNTTDDIYKRILTWRFYKGDGHIFNVRWLKRRIMRFLNGTNGTAPPITDTNQVSVIFGAGNTITIRFNTVIYSESGGLINTFQLNTMQVNNTLQTITPLPGGAYIDVLISALNSGILDLPFQYNFVLISA